jgi:hypothetical protein
MPLPKDHRRVRATEIRAILIRAIRIRGMETRASQIRAIRIRAMETRAIQIRVMEIRPILIRAMGSQPTWGHLRCALMATTPFTRTPARPTATMDQAGSQAGSLLAPGRGASAMVGAASPADLALADAATMEAGRPFPGVEDYALGSVTVTPDGLRAAVVPSVGAAMPSAAADAPSAGVDVPSVGADMPPEAVDAPSVAAHMPSAAVDMAAAMPSAAVDMAAEAEVVMVVDAGRFHHQLEVLAADSTRCRPLRFRSRGQTAGRRKPYAICEVFQDTSKPGDQDFRDAIVPCPRARNVCNASNCFRVHRRSPPAGSSGTKVPAKCTKSRLRLLWFFLNRQLRARPVNFFKDSGPS